MIRSLVAHQEHAQAARDTHTDSNAIGDLHGAPPELPEALAQWLGRLMLLRGVPFHYLTPDDRMLPKESTRFFTVDRNWTAALIDGATSIGRILTSDLEHDRAFFANKDDGTLAQARAAAGISAEVVTGFLLRSALVEGWWPGIQIDGFPSTDHTPNPDERLDILRLERLSPSVLLCLFDGQVQRVNIHEPPEGLHFGLDKPDDEGDATPFYRQLRHRDGTLTDPVEHIKVAENWHDPNGCLRLDERGQPTRTVKMSKLAQRLAPFRLDQHSLDDLRNNGLPDKNLASLNGIKDQQFDTEKMFLEAVEQTIGRENIAAYQELILKHAERNPFTAAEFALAMVEGVDLVGFGHEDAA